jgi:HlyD family secretion protein
VTPKSSGAHEISIRRHLAVGLGVLGVFVLGMGGVAGMTEISGAIVAGGTLMVETQVKKIQHPTGGIVREIDIREGDRVKAGEILIRLDDTAIRTNLAIVTKTLDQSEIKRARLIAERDKAEEIVFPPHIRARETQPHIAQTTAGERSLFALRRSARAGQKSQLEERLAQLESEALGLSKQQDAKQQEIRLVQQELVGIRKLWESKLIAMDRLVALERDLASLEGEHGQLTAAIAQVKGRGSEIRLQILQIDEELRSTVATELREVEDKIAELDERRIVAEDELKRIDIRSPQDGVIHQLSVHTIGGVISAGEVLMLIVPVMDRLIIQARIAPQDVDQLVPGQVVTVRLSAFNQRTTPEVSGLLTHISADLAFDDRSGDAFYSARINLPAGELAGLSNMPLVPGMPVEVFFPTHERSILSYLLKPLADQMQRVFREE